MMKKGNETFGNNIKILREINNETLKKLANAIGVEYQSIQKYENGISNPSKKNMEKILKHYNYLGLSEADLLNNDLSYLKEQFERDIGKTLEYICPIVYTENSLKNDSFKQAYELQKLVYTSDVFDVNIFNDIQILYSKCIDENFFILETYMNLLSFFIYYEITYKAGLCMKTKINPNNYIHKDEITRRKELFLLNCEGCQEYEEDYTREKCGDGLEYFISIHNHTLELLNAVKLLGNYDLVYYYITILYIYDCIPNEFDRVNNRRIGYEMLQRLCETNNEYAKKYLNYYNNFQ